MKTLIYASAMARTLGVVVTLTAGLTMGACSSDDTGQPTVATVTGGPGTGTAGSGGASGDAGSGGVSGNAGSGGAGEGDAGSEGGVIADAGSEAPRGDGGPVVSNDPRCLPDGSVTADAGCVCVLTSTKDFLNQCTSNQCQPYDNTRIKYPGWTPGQALPPVP